jgi:hypothetical protein
MKTKVGEMKGLLGWVMSIAVMALLMCVPGQVGAEVTGVVVPSLGITVVDLPVGFSSATFDAPGVVGTLEAGDKVKLVVTDGVLTLAQTEGLLFYAGDGTEDQTITFIGDTESASAALDGLVYTPPEEFAGSVVIKMTIIGESTKSGSWRVVIHAPLDAALVRAAILDGVTEIHSGVQPGNMVAYGPEAYDAAWYPGGQAEGTMIAFASWGAGRVIAVPDHQMLAMDLYGDVSGQFYVNGLAWLAGTTDVSIRIVTKSEGVADWLTLHGFTDVMVADEAALGIALLDADVLVPDWLGADVSQETLEAIGEFVRQGGGLFIADYGVGYEWWWGKPIHQAPGNLLLREAGIGFTGGNRWETESLALSDPASGQVNADALMTMLGNDNPFSNKELERAGLLFERIFDALGLDDPLVKRLDAAFWDRVLQISATPETPVDSKWEQALLVREGYLLEVAAVAELEKHRTVDAVYGPVPDGALRVNQSVTIDPAITRWHTTGLYAAPGEVVTVQVPPQVVGVGFEIQVSGHVDDISVRDSWLRMPRVARSFSIDAEEVLVGSSFGGALYVNVGTEQSGLGPFDVIFNNVVEAPFFILGETNNEEWVGEIRDLPAPYAEFVSEHLSFSLPSDFIRDLDDMEAVVAFWNEVVTFQDDLAGHADLRTNAERINIDVQVSGGYLHAGYPIQGPLIPGQEMVDYQQLLQAGAWGWFHELGHEAQRRPDKSWGWDNAYTFDGAVEATVNIFSTYAYDVMGIPGRGGWSWTGSRVAVMKKALAGLADDGLFSAVNVEAKLAMFLQLRDGWTWEAFKTVFVWYNAADPAELPANEQDERDQFLVGWSEAVGHDLGPFFEDVWGIDVSEPARAAVASLPDWLPARGGIEGEFFHPMGIARAFDLAGEALSHDGVAAVTNVTQGDHGTLTDSGDGSWLYEPESGYLGPDSFTYTVVSSTGHEVTSTVILDISSKGVLAERWDGIPGAAVSTLTNSPDFPDNPDLVSVLQAIKTPENWGDSFGIRLRGFLVPPKSGDYTFWIAADDTAELWLGTDHNQGTASLIASVSTWTLPEQWDKYEGQQSVGFSLVKGHVYYLEVLMKESGWGDHLAVAWAYEDSDKEIISGADVNIYRDGNESPDAVADNGETYVGIPLTIDVLGNDIDADGDLLYVLSWDNSAEVSVTQDGNGNLLFLRPDGAGGTDTFTYLAADGYGGTATAEVSVKVTLDCALVTCNDFNLCTDDYCDEQTGCVYAPNAASCDDGDFCTTGDYCLDAVCTGGVSAVCDDLNPCTDDTCDSGSGCVFVPNQSACEDGDLCTGPDGCASGECVVGGPVTCDDGTDCTFDSCSPESGCVFTPDHSLCEDSNICTDDVCESVTGCAFPTNELACEDGNLCTGPDVCSEGSCAAGPAVSCDDGNSCTNDSCSAEIGCLTEDNQVVCDDDNLCTDGDLCANGICAGAKAVICDDSNPCTGDTCVPATGCQFEPKEGICYDGDFCTAPDFCADSICTAGPEVICEDYNPCTSNSCQPETGCVYAPVQASCDDEDLCTEEDLCDEGECVAGAMVDCDDDDPCTDDMCNPAIGCVSEPVAGCCNSSNQCETGEICLELECQSAQCRACEEDTDCGNGSFCTALGSGDFCLLPCDGDLCPDGAICVDSDIPLCMPDQGDCICTSGAGTTCDGDHLLDVDTCGQVGELLEECARGCVEGLGCCPEGSVAEDGECVDDTPGQDLVEEPDVVEIPDIIEASEILQDNGPAPSDMNAKEIVPDMAPAPDFSDSGTGDSSTLVTSKRRKGGCGASPNSSSGWLLLVLLAMVLAVFRARYVSGNRFQLDLE